MVFFFVVVVVVKILILLWNLKVHVDKNLPLVPVLSQMELVHTVVPCLL